MQSKYSVTHHVFFVCTQLFIARCRIMAVVVVVCVWGGGVGTVISCNWFLSDVNFDASRIPPTPTLSSFPLR